MKRMLALLVVVALTACGQKKEFAAADASMNSVATAPAAPAPMMKEAAGEAGSPQTSDAAPLRRHIAVRHDLQLQTEAGAVESAWRSANQACVAAGCEVLSSSLSRNDSRGPAHAQLDARVPPEKLEAFLQQLSALGSVGQHSKTAEDKTDEVIDVEARLKNMAQFRDHLRQLMATPGAKLKDLIEVERELVRVQSELDSLASQRKALASLTGKVRVSVNISARPTVLEEGVWSPVGEAFTGAGRLLARSVAGLISVFVAILPWVVLVLVLGVGLRAVWRRRRG